MHFLAVYTLFWPTLRVRLLGTPSGQQDCNFVRVRMPRPQGLKKERSFGLIRLRSLRLNVGCHSSDYEWNLGLTSRMLPLIAIVAASGGIYLLLSSCASSLRRWLIEKYTGVADVAFLGFARPKEHKIQGVAVICGGR